MRKIVQIVLLAVMALVGVVGVAYSIEVGMHWYAVAITGGIIVVSNTISQLIKLYDKA